jgi:anti-anti-sigma factor
MSIIKTRNINHWEVIRFLAPRLTDPVTVAQVQNNLETIIETLPLRCQVAVDFSHVEYVSSQVIGMMLGLRDRVNKKHGTLVLCKLNKHVLDVMKITRLDRHFTFSDSVSRVTGHTERVRAGKSEVEWMD